MGFWTKTLYFAGGFGASQLYFAQKLSVLKTEESKKVQKRMEDLLADPKLDKYRRSDEQQL